VTRRIGFLRAVNLGRRRVPMVRLTQVCTDLGHTDVWTYVNSGNVIFSATGPRAAIESRLEKALEAEFGFECTTFVRTTAELRAILDVEPFDVAAGDTYFVTFLKVAPSKADAATLEGLSNEFESLVVRGAEVHWRMHGKSTDSKLVKRDWEKVLGVNSSTSRNTTMLRKLAAKAAAQ